MLDYISIKGKQQAQISVSATAAKSPPLPAGVYDIWGDADIWVRVAPFASRGVVTPSPARAEDVTTSNGYQIFAGNIVSFRLEDGDIIGAIAGGATTARYMQTGA